MQTVILFAVTLGLVFVKAFQQRNVAHGHTKLVPITSCVFAALEIASIGIIAQAFIGGGNLLHTWAALAAGGAIGSVSAIKVHQRIMR